MKHHVRLIRISGASRGGGRRGVSPLRRVQHSLFERPFHYRKNRGSWPEDRGCVPRPDEVRAGKASARARRNKSPRKADRKGTRWC